MGCLVFGFIVVWVVFTFAAVAVFESVNLYSSSNEVLPVFCRLISMVIFSESLIGFRKSAWAFTTGVINSFSSMIWRRVFHCSRKDSKH